MKKQLGPYLRTFFVVLVTAGIFYALFTRISFVAVFDTLTQANPWYLVLALLLNLSFPFIGARRWQVILKAMQEAVSYLECLYILMGALPLTSITPAKSGDIIKGYYFRDKIQVTKTVGSVLTERVFDILMLILFSIAGLIIYHTFELVGIAFAILAATIAFLLVPRIEIRLPIKQSWNDKLGNLLFSVKTLTKDRRRLLAVLGYTSASWFLSIVQTMFFFLALGIHIPFFFMVANIPIAILIGMIPIALGGMGTRDYAIIHLFSNYAEPAQLLGSGILFSAFRYWFFSIIGIPFMRRLMKGG